MIGLDTNVLVGHLGQDDPGFQRESKSIVMPDPILGLVLLHCGE
jgi:hypothetical protein